VLHKIIPDFTLDRQGAGVEDMKQMGLSGEAAGRGQDQITQFSTTTRTSHRPLHGRRRSRRATSSAQRGSMRSTATHRAPTGLWPPRSKGTTGGRVLVFVVGAFAEMSEDVSRICDIIAHDLARTHISYYNDDTKHTKGMYRQRIQKAEGTHGAPRLGPPPPPPRPRPGHLRPGAPRRQRRGDADGRGRSGRPLLLYPPREGWLLRCLGARGHCCCSLDSTGLAL